VSGNIWALNRDDMLARKNGLKAKLLANLKNISSFAMDADGELLMIVRDEAKIVKF